MIRYIAVILLGFGGIILITWLLLTVPQVIFFLRIKGIERSICLLTNNACIHLDDGIDCSRCHLCGGSPPNRRAAGDEEDDDRK